MIHLKNTAVIGLLILAQSAFAADDRPPSLTSEEKNFTAPTNKNTEIPPNLPNEADDSRNIPQPEVRIIRKKDSVVEEYRVNGRLRFIKITPSVGNPYYMVDTDGDGILETRNDNFANPPINQWILLEW